MRRRDGQVWSLDYTIGFVLFTLSLLLAASVLMRTVMSQDDFAVLQSNAETMSDQLLSAGYPEHWRTDDIVIAGLLTNNHLSLRKAERLQMLADEDYGASKAHVNTKYEYALTFAEPNGSLLPVNDDCYIGSAAVNEQKNALVANRSYGYYYRGGQLLKNAMESMNMTVTTGDELNNFLLNLSMFDYAILEQPGLNGVDAPYDGEKAELLKNYVEEGATLLLIGNVSLPEFFALNLTAVNQTIDANATNSNDTFLNLSGLGIENITGTHAIVDNGLERYESLAVLSDGRDYAARFTHGDGDVYYLGGLSGTLNTSGTLLSHVEQQLNSSRTYASADCNDVELPLAKNRVVVTRLVAYEGRVLTLTLTMWENK